LIREHRSFFLATALAALALRLLFFVYFPMVTDDTRVYADFATNWLQHGIYGHTQASQQGTYIMPADSRLFGYPAFLAGIFWLFGVGNFKAVMLAQVLVGLATCLIVADLARRVVSDRAARIAFLLTALCPFLANYAAAVLTETLEIFFTALALDCAAAALARMHEARLSVGVPSASSGQGLDQTCRKLWAASGAAVAVNSLFDMALDFCCADAWLPVVADDVPHHRRKPEFAGGAEDVRTARAMGRAEVFDLFAEHIFESRVAIG